MKRIDHDTHLGHKAALALARKHGCSVTPMNGGEVRIVTPCGGQRVNSNNRRKDASMATMGVLRHAIYADCCGGGRT